MPVFHAHLIKPGTEFQKSVYPTRAMFEKVRKEADIIFKKIYGITMLPASDSEKEEIS